VEKLDNVERLFLFLFFTHF